MMRLLYVFAGLALVVVVAAILAPATLANHWLRDASGGSLALARTAGTIWRGQGDLAMLVTGGHRIALRGMSWRVSPWSALSGTIEGEIIGTSGPAGESARGRFRIHGATIELTDVALTLPADTIGAMALPPAFAPSGSMTLEIVSLTWSPPARGGGEGRLRWRDAVLRLPFDPSPLAFGTVDARFGAHRDRFVYAFSSDGGTIALEGQGEWLPGHLPTIRGTLRRTASTPEPLMLMLSRLGAATADGSVPLVFPMTGPSTPH